MAALPSALGSSAVPTARRSLPRVLPTTVVALLTCALGAMYLWRAIVRSVPLRPGGDPRATAWLGVDRWAFLGRPWPWLFVALALLAGLMVARWPSECRQVVLGVRTMLDRVWVRSGLAVAAVVSFWFGSSRQLNLDGSLLQQKFATANTASGAFVTHDEMLELYLHSRLWRLMHWEWGWDVALTYRALSCLAGGVAVFLGLGLARRFPAPRWPFVVVGLFAGGWVLIFFGDVENYTLTNVLVLAYLAAALRYVDEPGVRLWPVGALLGVAVLFHLESLVLAPSLLVLTHIAYRRGNRLDACAAAGALPVLLAATLWWFDRNGLPISALASHSQISAQGGHWTAFLVAPSTGNLWLQLQLLVLLAPAVVLVPALLIGPVGAGDRVGSRYLPFLGVAAIGPLLLVAVWRAQLGDYQDWDLYAIAAQPLGLFVFGALTTQARIGRQAPWLVAALVLMGSQSLAWILEHQAPMPG